MLKIAITGAAGRMGKTLIEACHQADDCSVNAAIERSGITLLGADAGEIAGIGILNVTLVDDLTRVLDDFDVLIDFTSIETTLTNLEICKNNNKQIIIGTTGFNEEQKKIIEQAAENIAVVFAPNILKLLQTAAAIFSEDYDIEVIEAHHRHKVDAPSGTH